VPAFLSVFSGSDSFDPYFQNWILFVSALNILMPEKVKTDDLSRAEELLKLFVIELETLYGETVHSYNVHQLLHLCLHVRRWGPMVYTNPFEENIGSLGKSVHGNLNVGTEITQRLRLSQCGEVLRSTVAIRNLTAVSVNECLGSALKETSLTREEMTLLLCTGVPKEKIMILYLLEQEYIVLSIPFCCTKMSAPLITVFVISSAKITLWVK